MVEKNQKKSKGLTRNKKRFMLSYEFNKQIPLFRVVEIQRICEATATPETEGADLSEQFEQ